MPKFIDIKNQKFGRWLAIRYVKSEAKWLCVCDCGTQKLVASACLRKRKTTSCGCYKNELQTQHGLWKSPEYRAWIDMKQRCFNKNSPSYFRYGARGISVCAEWENSFETFFEDMGKKPSPHHSLDRVDNFGDYRPENCRWATRFEQMNNVRRNNTISYKGESLTITEWSRKTGIHRNTITGRLNSGWSPTEILETKVGSRK